MNNGQEVRCHVYNEILFGWFGSHGYLHYIVWSSTLVGILFMVEIVTYIEVYGWDVIYIELYGWDYEYIEFQGKIAKASFTGPFTTNEPFTTDEGLLKTVPWPKTPGNHFCCLF